ncbi:MAG: ATPase, T2SS/T4P/T4SS family, partial [Candidatus Veblenbacteria bacterium]|nr:ATPase, T2SS/T4P/T4SS family [Candidatus Veblenbacteria bacterium]
MINLLTSSTSKLAKVLEQEGCCTREQFKEVEAQAKHEGRPVTAVLLEHANGGAEKTLDVLSQYYELEPVTLRGRVISPYVLNLIPKEVAEAHHVVVFKKSGDLISVATIDPENKQIIDFIQRKTKLEPIIFLTTPADIAYALQRYEGELSEEFAKIIEESLKETLASHEPMEKLAQFVPVVKMVNNIIDRALSSRASDIHLEPGSEMLLVRFRIDGLLKRVVELPREVLPPILARIKLMANLKIDEHRVPQDGRFRHTFNDREVALRVSVVPNLYGSKVVLRLLDAKEKRFDFKALGLNKRDLTILKHEATKPHGMIVVTGPTGSGKTT